MLAAESRIPFSDLRQGRLTKEQYHDLNHRLTKRLRNRTIWIKDEHPIDVRSIAAKCRLFKRSGLAAVVVDYLQLVLPSSSKRDASREREVRNFHARSRA
jgi:replicative DNA helicase